MKCIDCKDRAVMTAMSEGECEICGKKVISAYAPCDKLCRKCSQETQACQCCGKEMMFPEVTVPRWVLRRALTYLMIYRFSCPDELINKKGFNDLMDKLESHLE